MNFETDKITLRFVGSVPARYVRDHIKTLLGATATTRRALPVYKGHICHEWSVVFKARTWAQELEILQWVKTKYELVDEGTHKVFYYPGTSPKESQ